MASLKVNNETCLKSFTQIQVLVTFVLAILVSGLSLFQYFFSPNVLVLSHRTKAPWIMAPVYEGLCWIYPDKPRPSATFTKLFDVSTANRRVILSGRALREMQITVNDHQLPDENVRRGNWKKEIRVNLSKYIMVGTNSLRINVKNLNGPQLLSLQIEGLSQPLATDETWDVNIEGVVSGKAILADDTLAPPEVNVFRLKPTSSIPSFQQKKSELAFLFTASAIIALLVSFLFQGKSTRKWDAFLYAAIVGYWILFLKKSLDFPLALGYDIEGHLQYILYIFETKKLPLSGNPYSVPDFAFGHPPLYYLLSANVLRFAKIGLHDEILLKSLKIIPWISGFGQIWISRIIAGEIFKDDIVKRRFSLITAAVIPINLFMSAYISNEALHGFLAAVGLLGTVIILGKSNSKLWQFAILGAILGLGFLTKITSVIILPVICFFTVVKLIFIEKARIRRASTSMLVFLLSFLIITGWYFLMNQTQFGKLLPEQGMNVTLWQSPGYHYLEYFFKFGTVLIQPFYAGVSSFWDGLYSTFWGDGYFASETQWIGWNYAYMVMSYMLALPATIIMLIGLAKSLYLIYRNSDLNLRLQLAFLVSLVFAFVLFKLYVVSTCPYWTFPKAFYGLFLVAPISVIAALGFGTVHDWLSARWLLFLRAIFYGWFGTFIFVILITYVAPFASPVPISSSSKTDSKFFWEKESRQSNNGSIKSEPDKKENFSIGHWQARDHYAKGHAAMEKRELESAIKHYSEAVRLNPEYAEAYNSLAIAYTFFGRFEEAVRNYDEALRLWPDYEEAKHNRENISEIINKSPEEQKQFLESLKYQVGN